MRKVVLALLIGAFVAGPFSSLASADHDPVREAFCKVADKLGVVWVQDCNLH